MRTIHYSPAVAALALAMVGCQPADEYTVKGTLAEPFTGKVYLTYIKDRLTAIDSLTLDGSNTFEFKGTAEHPEQYRIMTSPRRYDASFIAEAGGSYQLDLKGYDDNRVTVLQGGEEQKLMNEYLQSAAPFRQKDKELSQAYETIDRSNAAQADSLQRLMSDNFQAREQAAIGFIRQHPRTFTAVLLAGDLLLYTYPEVKELYDRLDTVSYAYNYHFRQFKEKYEDARAHWLQGSPAPDFTTRDIDGKEVRLSDFRGSYVLLDFWASWCRPCRTRAKELKAVYDRLQARGIRVCGLSMDEKRGQWEAATREDGILWTNTGDLKPFKENAIAAAYKVTNLPTLFLVGPEGTIVMQNPELADLLELPVKK